MPGEIFMAPPLNDGDLAKQSEILAMRAIGDAVTRVGASVDKLVDKVDDVRDRVTRLEAHNEEMERIRRDVDSASLRISALEAEKQRGDGAKGVWSWLSKALPWIWPLGAGIAGAVGVKALDHPH